MRFLSPIITGTIVFTLFAPSAAALSVPTSVEELGEQPQCEGLAGAERWACSAARRAWNNAYRQITWQKRQEKRQMERGVKIDEILEAVRKGFRKDFLQDKRERRDHLKQGGTPNEFYDQKKSTIRQRLDQRSALPSSRERSTGTSARAASSRYIRAGNLGNTSVKGRSGIRACRSRPSREWQACFDKFR